MWKKCKDPFFLLLIFTVTFLIYFFSNLHPLDWYRHYVFLADSFLKGRLDVPQIPDFYQDVINLGGKKFLPFGPAPAIFLMPLVAIFGTGLSQVTISMFIGSINAVLVWLILEKLSLKFFLRVILTSGFAFGTVHFYAATTGTTWFFAHIMAVFFLLLAILEKLGKSRPLILGFLAGLAFLSREPVILAVPFFTFPFLKEKRTDKLVYFFVGMLPAIFFELFYNFFRFGNIFETGYGIIYNSYINSDINYSFLRTLVPKTFPHFGQFDIRNIPLHLYTFFLMVPKFSLSWPFFVPSKYGMSILLTSPFLIYAVFAKNNNLVKLLWFTIFLIAIPISLHFTQGWVQFGYRFALDFLPFLLILTALGFYKGPLKLKVLLVMFSIIVNVWGNWWARTHGW